MDNNEEINEENLVAVEESPELWERVLMMIGVIGFEEGKTWAEDAREEIWQRIEAIPEDSVEIPESILDSISDLMNKVIQEFKNPKIESVLSYIPSTNEDFILFQNRIALMLIAFSDMYLEEEESWNDVLDEYSEFIKEEFTGFEEDFEAAYAEFDLALTEKEDFFLANFFPERYEAETDSEEQ